MEVSLTLKLILSLKTNMFVLTRIEYYLDYLVLVYWMGWIKRKANLVRKYLETIALFREGLNLLRSAQLVNSLIFRCVQQIYHDYIVVHWTLLPDNCVVMC